MPESVRVSISTSTILKFFLVLLGLLVAYVLRDVIAILVVAVVFAAALDPIVDGLQRRRLPRTVGILLIFLIVLGVFAVIGALFVPLVRDQVESLKATLPGLTSSVLDFFERVQGTVPGNASSGLDSSLTNLTANLFSGIAGVFGGIVTTFGVLVLTFYLTVQEQGFRRFLTAIAPRSEHPRVERIISRIQERLGVWLRGQLLLTLIIGAASYVGLLILGVKFTLVLALIAGVTEFVPIAGPILGAVPAVVVGLNDSPLKAGLVVLLYILIQQLENHVIVPKVMSRVTGLNPAVVIVVMLVGAKLAGIAGILLAIPLTIIGQVLVQELWENRPSEAA